MPSKVAIPDSPLDRFTAIYQAMAKISPWWTDASRLRHGAMAAIMCDGDAREVAQRVRATSKALEKASPWHWGVSSSVQFAVSALLLQNGDTPTGFIKELKRVRKLFRQQGLHRALQYELLAVLILRIQANNKPISSEAIHRFKVIYEEMKRHHRWLTGPDDFPACAILTGQPGAPRKLGDDIEGLYQELHNHKFDKGNALQTAANIMYLAEGSSRTVARRAANLRDELKRHKIRTSSYDYHELAVLAMLELPADRIARRVVEIREGLRRIRPKIHLGRPLALAAGIAFVDLVAPTEKAKAASNASTLIRVQAMVAAQQAVLMAVAATAVVATTMSSN